MDDMMSHFALALDARTGRKCKMAALYGFGCGLRGLAVQRGDEIGRETILYCTMLYYTILYYTTLYYTIRLGWCMAGVGPVLPGIGWPGSATTVLPVRSWPVEIPRVEFE